MKKSRKKLKGMSLMEMIVSIAIFATLSLVLIRIGVTIDNTTKATTNLKEKVTDQSYYAANGITIYGYEADGITPKTFDSTTVDIDIELTGVTGSYQKLKDPDDWSKGFDDTVYTYNSPGIDLEGTKNNTITLYTEGMTSDELDEYHENPNGGLNLEFITDIQPTT